MDDKRNLATMPRFCGSCAFLLYIPHEQQLGDDKGRGRGTHPRSVALFYHSQARLHLLQGRTLRKKKELTQLER